MDQTKIQDIVRHITKDEDYGVGMMENLTLSDAVEVMTQMIPTLKKRAKEQGNSNDLAYFNRIENIYAKVMADKLRNEEHLWVVYCNTTAYPYMIDDDIMVLYNNKNASLLEKKLKLSGYEVSVGVENKEQYEFLRDIFCDEIQGYYFSRPISSEEYIKKMTKGAL